MKSQRSSRTAETKLFIPVGCHGNTLVFPSASLERWYHARYHAPPPPPPPSPPLPPPSSPPSPPPSSFLVPSFFHLFPFILHFSCFFFFLCLSFVSSPYPLSSFSFSLLLSTLFLSSFLLYFPISFFFFFFVFV